MRRYTRTYSTIWRWGHVGIGIIGDNKVIGSTENAVRVNREDRLCRGPVHE